ncbi:helix-turn-helix domain-containing protein [Streptomyces sp. NPDC087532]|uniref:helix-turn-helix domain-containing protein n=1 Tax=Streptomyces sp. NPDC087532 TaxID=3365795 RepID=UPI0037F96A7C
MTVVPAAWLLQRARLEPVTQTALARFLGVAQPSVHRYLTGEREPTFADLQRLIAGKGCRVELLVWTEPQATFPFQEDRLTAASPAGSKSPRWPDCCPPRCNASTGASSATSLTDPPLAKHWDGSMNCASCPDRSLPPDVG